LVPSARFPDLLSVLSARRIMQHHKAPADVGETLQKHTDPSHLLGAIE